MEDLSLSTLIWLRMARFVQNSNQLSNEHLRQFGLTVAQFEALAHIRNFEPITQSALAEGLTVSSGGISRMLARLEAEGLQLVEPLLALPAHLHQAHLSQHPKMLGRLRLGHAQLAG